jgi:hypothetical protein
VRKIPPPKYSSEDKCRLTGIFLALLKASNRNPLHLVEAHKLGQTIFNKSASRAAI